MENQIENVSAERARRAAEARKRKEQQKKKMILHYTMLGLFLLMFILQISAVVGICRLKMLPGFLIFLIVLVFLAYTGLTFWYLFLRGRKVPKKMAKKAAKKRRLIGCVLALVMLIGCVVISTVTNDVRKAIASVQADPVQDTKTAITRTVFVRSFDTAETLMDAKDYSFGILKGYDDVCTQQTVTAIEAEVGGKIKTQEYLSVFEMANALMAGDLNAMILKSGFISILEADERYEMFSNYTRVLVDVEIEGDGAELDGSGLLLNAEGDIAENGKLKPFVMYLSGSDSRQGILNGNTRSDVNILAVVNPETRQVLLLNTPRDFYVPMPLVEGAYDKLTHCGVYGINCSMKALAALYNCEVKYYVQINFQGLEKLVDAIGGITVESDVAFDLYMGAGRIKEGTNELNGKKALAFARTRKGLDGGDGDRGKNQMKVIKAIVDKATTGSTIITNYSSIMGSIDGMFVMNMPTALISEVVKRQVSDMSGWNIMSFSVKGTSDELECYSAPGQKLYVIQPSERYLAKASDLIQKVFAGEILTEQMVAIS